MGRILAIDYGKKFCGIAVTDPDRIIASPLETVDTPQLVKFLSAYFQNEGVDILVLGYPLDLEGNPTDATPLVDHFANTVKRKFPNVQLELIEEEFTTKRAKEALFQAGLKQKDRKKQTGNIDKVSAALILQDYLDTL